MEVKLQIESCSSDTSQQQESLAAARRELASQHRELETLSSKLSKREKTLTAAEANESKVKKTLDKETERTREHSEEFDRKSEALAERLKQCEKAAKAVAQKEKALAEVCKDIEDQRRQLSERAAQIEEHALELGTKDETLRREQNDLERIRGELNREDKTVQSQVEVARQEAGEARNQMGLAIEAQNRLQQQLEKSQRDHEEQIAAETAERTQRDQRVTKLEKNLANAEQRAEEASSLLKQAEIDRAALPESAAGTQTETEWRHACHAGIGAFWADFRMAVESHDGVELSVAAKDVQAETDTAVTPASGGPSAQDSTLLPQPDDKAPVDPGEEEFSQAAAMKAAMAAARAELEEEDEAPPRPATASAHPPASSAPAVFDSPGAPGPRAGESKATPIAPVAKPVSNKNAAIPSDLDPKTAIALRTLRRMNPNKSIDELLAQIAARKPEKIVAKKTKKGWFSRR